MKEIEMKAKVTEGEDEMPRNVANLPPDLRARARQAAALRIKAILEEAGEVARCLDVLIEERDDPRLDDMMICAMVNGAARLCQKSAEHYGAVAETAPTSKLRKKLLKEASQGRL